MTKDNKKRSVCMSPFWSGFGSTLVLRPQRTSLHFLYHGRDIQKSTIQECLAEDWENVYCAINHNFAIGIPAAAPSAKREEEDALTRR